MDIQAAIKQTVNDLGKRLLGFKVSQVGAHSILSGAVLSMYLNRVYVIEIMLHGQWTSIAFLDYIKYQVLELSSDVSNKMLKTDNFITLPTHQLEPLTRTSHVLSACSSNSKSFIQAPPLLLTFQSSLFSSLTTTIKVYLN